MFEPFAEEALYVARFLLGLSIKRPLLILFSTSFARTDEPKTRPAAVMAARSHDRLRLHFISPSRASEDAVIACSLYRTRASRVSDMFFIPAPTLLPRAGTSASGPIKSDVHEIISECMCSWYVVSKNYRCFISFPQALSSRWWAMLYANGADYIYQWRCCEFKRTWRRIKLVSYHKRKKPKLDHSRYNAMTTGSEKVCNIKSEL